MCIPSLPKHNLLMQQRGFSRQTEDAQQPAFNQTGGNSWNSSEDDGPNNHCSWEQGASSNEEASGDYACSQDQQHRSSSEDNAFSDCHSAAPLKKKRIFREREREEQIQRTSLVVQCRFQLLLYLWSRSLWATGAQQASRCSFHSSTYWLQATRSCCH